MSFAGPVQISSCTPKKCLHLSVIIADDGVQVDNENIDELNNKIADLVEKLNFVNSSSTSGRSPVLLE